MNICGLIDAELKKGEFEFTWPVYVAPIRDDILLGCDIIDEMDITVNTKRGIQVKDQWVECEITRSHDSIGPVKVARAVTVPAYSEFVMTGLCNSLPAEEDKTFIFETSEVAKEKLLIAKSLTRPKSCKIPIKMINHSASPIRLKKRLVLGTLQPEGSVKPTNEEYYNIRQHEEGVSVCRLKTHEDKHQRELSNAQSSSNKEKSHPDSTNFTCIFDEEDGTSAYSQVSRTNQSLIPEVPVHLQELFHQSTASLESGQKRKLKKLLLKYQDAFAKAPTELGKCSLLKHKIDTAEAQSVRQPMRRTPQAFEGEEEKYLKEQLAAGVIQPSSSPWSSPIVMVRKKTEDVRVCIDYRKMNKRTIKDAYPLPRIDMCLDCLSSAKIYSTIDLQSAFMQLELEAVDRHKTAFITKYGLFEYLLMPFGLCNAPSTFQRCMELIFRGLQWNILLVYLDDIIVIALNFNKHLDRLEEVFKRLSEAGLKMKPSKCELFKTQVLFLGNLVSRAGLSPNPKTVEAVLSWKVQSTVKEIQSYMGLCSYYRQYTENFSHIAAPLTRLMKKNVKFIWDESCQIAFETLKEKLCSSPIVAYTKPGLKYILDTDASDVGICAVLSQVQDGKERVIAYASKKLKAQQQRYSVTRCELLAVITFMNYFRHFLLGQKFLLRTDHGSLRWIFEFKDPRGQVARWLEILAQYDFEIQHRPGNKHNNADSLSRRDYEKSGCTHATTDVDNCTECQNQNTEWEEFLTEVDNVVDLGMSVSEDQCRNLVTSNSYNVRAFTRRQAKEMAQTKEPLRNTADQELPANREIAPEVMFCLVIVTMTFSCSNEKTMI